MSLLGWMVTVTTIAGVFGTGLGGVIGAVVRKDSGRMISLLLAFAGGIMTAVVCFDLMPEAIQPEGAAETVSMLIVTCGVLLGYGTVYILNYLIDRKTNPEMQHIDKDHPLTADNVDELIHADHYNQHAKDPGSGKYDLFIAGVVMAGAIALHNMPEGMVIGASYAGSQNGMTGGAGLIVAVVIGLHNIPEGMAVSVPLISGGMKKRKAVLITALSGAPTVLGALIGYTLGMLSPMWLSVSLSFAGGAMLYVVFGELLPEAFLMWKSKAPGAAALFGTLIGFALVYI